MIQQSQVFSSIWQTIIIKYDKYSDVIDSERYSITTKSYQPVSNQDEELNSETTNERTIK